MTVDYTFAPILPIPRRIPWRIPWRTPTLAGVIWFADDLESRRVTWRRGEPISIVISAGRLAYVGHPRGRDLALRPRRRGQRPAGMPRSAWWRLPRRERRQIGGAP